MSSPLPITYSLSADVDVHGYIQGYYNCIVALVISHERAVQTAYFTYIRTYGDNRRITVYVVGLMVLYTGSTFMAGKERTER